jgi:hypothetical protein
LIYIRIPDGTKVNLADREFGLIRRQPNIPKFPENSRGDTHFRRQGGLPGSTP